MTIPEPVLKDLILSLHNKLVSVIKGIVYRVDIAEDIAMISWQTAWERREDIETIEQFRAFLFLAAKNHALTYMKGEKVRRRIEKRLPDLSIDNTTDASIITHNSIRTFKDIIKSRFGNRYLIVLTDQLDGYPAKYTADLFSVTESTITSMRNKIKTFLLQKFGREGVNPGAL